MFEVGFTEIILILGLALVVLGPEKLPGLAQKVGRWTGRARAMARQLRTQLEHEVTMEDLARSRPQSGPEQYDPTSDTYTPPAPDSPPEPPSAHDSHDAASAQAPSPDATADAAPSTTPNARHD